MSRTYLDRWRSLPVSPSRSAALLMAVGLGGVGVPLAAAGLFDSQPLNGNRFAVLAQPVGEDRWKLLVLEQVKARPFCWREREDGLVTPSLNSFDFSGICSRYLDSTAIPCGRVEKTWPPPSVYGLRRIVVACRYSHWTPNAANLCWWPAPPRTPEIGRPL